MHKESSNAQPFAYGTAREFVSAWGILFALLGTLTITCFPA